MEYAYEFTLVYIGSDGTKKPAGKCIYSGGENEGTIFTSGCGRRARFVGTRWRNIRESGGNWNEYQFNVPTGTTVVRRYQSDDGPGGNPDVNLGEYRAYPPWSDFEMLQILASPEALLDEDPWPDFDALPPRVDPQTLVDGIMGGTGRLVCDVDNDDDCDVADADIVQGLLGSCAGDLNFNSNADLNANGCINSEDLLLLSMATTGCYDGLDNDGDGLRDFSDDPGCRDAYSDTENPECQDGDDNDGDGLIDWDGGTSAGVLPEEQTGPDPHCFVSWKRTEAPSRGPCGLSVELALLLPPLMWLYRRRRLH